MPVKLTPQAFVDKYNAKQGLFKGGSLCFFGHWFGRPLDNLHRVIHAKFEDTTNVLTLTFDENETLTILNPINIVESKEELIIGSADKITWKWYSYEEIQTKENLCFIEITREADILTGQSNVEFHNSTFNTLNINSPAVTWV